MKYLVKLLLVVVVLFAGCFYYKVGLSTDNGIKVMDTKYKTYNDFALDYALGLANDPDVNSISYWKIPFMNKYYCAIDVNVSKNIINAGVDSGFYVMLLDKDVDESGKDNHLAKLNSLADVEGIKVNKPSEWIWFGFLVGAIVIIIFPTGKKKKY